MARVGRPPKRENQRRQRKAPPGHPKQKLNVRARPGYVQYWCYEHQIAEMQDKDYELVRKENVDGVGDAGDADTGLGSVVSMPAGRHDSRLLYCMEKRKEWYEEDQQVEQEEIDATEREIFNPQGGETTYVPGRVSKSDEKLG